MVQLEPLTPGAALRGVVPDARVTIVSVQWYGSEARELTYKTQTGKAGNQLLYRDHELRLEIVEQGRPWSFDGAGAPFRPVAEAQRIRLAHLSDPLLAIHTSNVAGAATITVGKNEVRYSLNKPDDFILAIVEFDGDAHRVHYVRRPFHREPDFGVTSVDYDLAELIAWADVPRREDPAPRTGKSTDGSAAWRRG
jgi:hypothetical protein